MEVSVSQLRAQLKDYLAQVKQGEAIVVTERGVPIAQLVSVDGASLLEQLEREGLLTAPTAERPPVPDFGSEPVAASGLAGLIKRLRR